METNETKKLTVSQLYRAAQKRGYRNSYGEFADIYNRHLTEQLSKKDLAAGESYLNDRGKTENEPDTETIIRTMPGVNRDAGPATPPPPPPTPSPAQPASEDKILGMNKYLFFGLAILSVLAIGTASVMLYRSYMKKVPAQVPGPVSAGATTAPMVPAVVVV